MHLSRIRNDGSNDSAGNHRAAVSVPLCAGATRGSNTELHSAAETRHADDN